MPTRSARRLFLSAAAAAVCIGSAGLADGQSTLSLRGGVTPEGPFSQLELMPTGDGTATLMLVDPTGTAYDGSIANTLVAWGLTVDFADLSLAPGVGSPATVSPAGVEVTQFSADFSAILDNYNYYVAARDGTLFGGPGNEPTLVGWGVLQDFTSISAPVELSAVGSAVGVAAVPGSGEVAVNRVDGVGALQQVTQTYSPDFLPIGSPVNGAASPFPVLEDPDIDVASDGTRVVSVRNFNNNTLQVYAIDAAGNRGPTQSLPSASNSDIHAMSGGRAVVVSMGAGGVVLNQVVDLLTVPVTIERPVHTGFGTNLHLSEASGDGIILATYTIDNAVYARAISATTGAPVSGSFLVSTAPAGGNVFNGASAPVGNGAWVHADIQQPSFNIITVGTIAHQGRDGVSLFQTDPGELLVLADAFPNRQTPADQSQNLTYQTPSFGSFALVENPESASDGAVAFEFEEQGTLTVTAGATWREVGQALGDGPIIVGVSFDLIVNDEVLAVDVGFAGWTIGGAFGEQTTIAGDDLDVFRGPFAGFELEAEVTAEDLAMVEEFAGVTIGGRALEFRRGGPSTRGTADPMGVVTVDNIRITARPVPEPGSAATLLVVVCCGTRTRRVRSR